MAVGSLKSNAIGLIPQAPPGGLLVSTMAGREAASETYVKGAVLIDNGGRVAEAAADPTTIILGVAAEPATGVTDTLVTFYPAWASIVFEATFEDQTNEDHALLIANIHSDYALQVDDDGIWYVDQNDEVAVSVTIVEPRSDEDITDATVRARVLVVFTAGTIWASVA